MAYIDWGQNVDEITERIVDRAKEATILILTEHEYKTDRTTKALEARVLAAEAVSQAATAQMTAVLAVLNVLAAYAGPPPPSTDVGPFLVPMIHGHNTAGHQCTGECR